jgi:hypothetical protein
VSAVTPPRPVILALPDEPADLRGRMLERIAADPVAGRGEVAGGAWLAGPLWNGPWGRELAVAGLDLDAFTVVVAGYDRELWLWLLGERTWAQAADGLAGRVRRRLPGSA